MDCAIAVDVEEMNPDALKSAFPDRPSALERANAVVNDLAGENAAPSNAIRQFAGTGMAHMKKYGARLETFAKIRAKASRHATRNPIARCRLGG